MIYVISLINIYIYWKGRLHIHIIFIERIWWCFPFEETWWQHNCGSLWCEPLKTVTTACIRREQVPSWNFKNEDAWKVETTNSMAIWVGYINYMENNVAHLSSTRKFWPEILSKNPFFDAEKSAIGCRHNFKESFQHRWRCTVCCLG